MKSNYLFAELVLYFLIFIVLFILIAGIYFVCRAVFYKARHVPRRHLKCWVPNVLSGMRPSGSSEMILAGAAEQNAGLMKKTSESFVTDQQTEDDPERGLQFHEAVSATVIPSGSWDEPQIDLLTTFSTPTQGISTNSNSSPLLQDYSTPPVIIPSVHSF